MDPQTFESTTAAADTAAMARCSVSWRPLALAAVLALLAPSVMFMRLLLSFAVEEGGGGA